MPVDTHPFIGVEKDLHLNHRDEESKEKKEKKIKWNTCRKILHVSPFCPKKSPLRVTPSFGVHKPDNYSLWVGKVGREIILFLEPPVRLLDIPQLAVHEREDINEVLRP
ncbi:MAG: hypothetical protein ACP5SH_06690, partial [Syntrophobacteraceae bacterium]